MIKLNLLPPIEKKYYKIETYRRFVIFFSIGIFIIFTIFIGLLFFNYIFVSLQLEPVVRQLEIEKATEKAKKIADFENQIKETNKKIALLTNIKKQSNPIMPLIEKIINDSMSKNSYLTNLLINRPEKIGSVKGFSLTRSQVINIQKNLIANMFLSEIKSPYSNFLKQTNIDFVFDFKLTQ